jgi:hypothetical protein
VRWWSGSRQPTGKQEEQKAEDKGQKAKVKCEEDDEGRGMQSDTGGYPRELRVRPSTVLKNEATDLIENKE